MKKIILIILLISSSSIISQNINLRELITFQNISLGQIEEKLILKDWDYVDKNNRQSKMFSSFNSITYDYTDLNEIKTKIILTKYNDKIRNDLDIELITGNKNLYKEFLKELISNNYYLNESKAQNHKIIQPLAEFKKGNKVLVDSNPKVYEKNNSTVIIYVNKYEIINSDETDVYYTESTKITEYIIKVKENK